MKKTILILSFVIFPFLVQCQPDKDFKEQITVVSIKYPDGSVQTTALPGIASVTWASVLNKPLTFPPAVHNHDLLYKPLTYVPAWTDILGKPLFAPVATSGSYDDLADKPVEEPLSDMIAGLPGLEMKPLTTAEILLLNTDNKVILVFNKTDSCLQLVSGHKIFKILITNQ